ncbi:MAG: hypothetical protein J3K34DRAFT_410322 [Monoraphidium minutum]|nr:MAG: hypothetical protein J3K34DRAFT_410322 [Monoraphidium minutum]
MPDMAVFVASRAHEMDAPTASAVLQHVTRNFEGAKADRPLFQETVLVLGAVIVQHSHEAGTRELATALWAWGRLATVGAFLESMKPHFADVLQAFNAGHVAHAKSMHASMGLGAVAYLAKAGARFRAERGLELAAAAAALGRLCALIDEGGEVSCQDVGDATWSLLQLRIPPPHHQLAALARHAAEPGAVAGATPAAISKLLWSLSELIAAGGTPPLSAGGPEWQRLVEGYLNATDAQGPDRKAASFYREAVQRLAGAAGGAQCISRQLAMRALQAVPAGH